MNDYENGKGVDDHDQLIARQCKMPILAMAEHHNLQHCGGTIGTKCALRTMRAL